MDARGFTLLELLMVLAVLAVILAIAPFNTGRLMGGAESKAAARDLASGLRQARQAAVQANRPLPFVLDLEAHRWGIGDGEPAHQLSARQRLSMFTATNEIVDRRRAAIRFYPDGSASGGRITVGEPPHAIMVSVDWVTGQVAIHE